MAYVCSTYPYEDDLSKARLTKLIYLSDWRSAVRRGRQITDIEWIYNHYGPYVHDVERLAVRSPDFVIESAFGTAKETIRLVGPVGPGTLKPPETDIIDSVIKQTRHMTYAEFLRHVYSTYPIKNSARYEVLDLVALAERRKKAKTG
jgi:hypothetical protein